MNALQEWTVCIPAGTKVRYRKKPLSGPKDEMWRYGTVKLVWWYDGPIHEIDNGDTVFPFLSDDLEVVQMTVESTS